MPLVVDEAMDTKAVVGDCERIKVDPTPRVSVKVTVEVPDDTNCAGDATERVSCPDS